MRTRQKKTFFGDNICLSVRLRFGIIFQTLGAILKSLLENFSKFVWEVKFSVTG
jgi:hypothetical protein